MTMTTTTVDWDSVHLTNYVGDLLSSHKWFQTAAELTACMAILEPHVLAWWQSIVEWQRKKARMFREHGFHSTYMMLAGFAIENIAKGALVQGLSGDEREEVRRSGILPNALRSHKLVNMVSQLGLTLNDADLDLLGRLQSAAVWSGRYPIPRVYRETQAIGLPGGQRVSVTWKGSADVYLIKEFIRRLREHVGAKSSYRAPQFADV